MIDNIQFMQNCSSIAKTRSSLLVIINEHNVFICIKRISRIALKTKISAKVKYSWSGIGDGSILFLGGAGSQKSNKCRTEN